MPQNSDEPDLTEQFALDPVIGDGVVTLPSFEEKKAMNEQAQMLHSQNMSQLGQTGIVAQNNFVTVAKAFDYDYLENKRMVTLDEAVGAREVASRESMAGKPATV